MLIGSLIILQHSAPEVHRGVGVYLRLCGLTNIQVHSRATQVVRILASLLGLGVHQLLITFHGTIEISHRERRVSLDRFREILDRLREILHQHEVHRTAKISVSVVRITLDLRRILVDGGKMHGDLILSQSGLLVRDTQFTLQDHLAIVILHHLVVINKFLYGIRLLVIGQDKLGFQIHMDIPVLYTPTDLTLVFTFTLLLLIVYHQAVELIDILIGLLTSILLRIVRLGISVHRCIGARRRCLRELSVLGLLLHLYGCPIITVCPHVIP